MIIGGYAGFQSATRLEDAQIIIAGKMPAYPAMRFLTHSPSEKIQHSKAQKNAATSKKPQRFCWVMMMGWSVPDLQRHPAGKMPAYPLFIALIGEDGTDSTADEA